MIQGVQVDAMDPNALTNKLFPLPSKPEMVYGTDLSIPLPFTKKKLNLSGKTLDRLSTAILSAAQNAYVPGSDTGGQFLKGLAQGYGGVRAQDYAERKKTFLEEQKKYQEAMKERGKFRSLLGVEQFKDSLKDKVDPNTGKVLVTEKTISEARKNGIAVPSELVGKYVSPGELIRSIPDRSVSDAIRQQQMGFNAQQLTASWMNSPAYTDYEKTRMAYTTAQNAMVNMTPANDLALLKAAERAIDPQTGVREGDVALWNGLSGIVEQAKSFLKKQEGKAFLPDKTRQEMYGLIEAMYGSNLQNITNKSNAMQEAAVSNGYTTNIYIVPEPVKKLEVKGPSNAASDARARNR